MESEAWLSKLESMDAVKLSHTHSHAYHPGYCLAVMAEPRSFDKNRKTLEAEKIYHLAL